MFTLQCIRIKKLIYPPLQISLHRKCTAPMLFSFLLSLLSLQVCASQSILCPRSSSLLCFTPPSSTLNWKQCLCSTQGHMQYSFLLEDIQSSVRSVGKVLQIKSEIKYHNKITKHDQDFRPVYQPSASAGLFFSWHSSQFMNQCYA